MNKEKIELIFETLGLLYPSPSPFLFHRDAFTLLVAIILSAQCTDARVNKVTPHLFPQYDTPEKILALGEENLKQIIKSCGYYNAKARNIYNLCGVLTEVHGGRVPSTLDELVTLSGVGRKTASVLLTQWFGVPAVPVDTHVHRVANRLGISCAKTPEKTEIDLRKNVPQRYWIEGHMQLIMHGRKICTARKPKCSVCPLNALCEWKGKVIGA